MRFAFVPTSPPPTRGERPTVHATASIGRPHPDDDIIPEAVPERRVGRFDLPRRRPTAIRSHLAHRRERAVEGLRWRYVQHQGLKIRVGLALLRSDFFSAAHGVGARLLSLAPVGERRCAIVALRLTIQACDDRLCLAPEDLILEVPVRPTEGVLQVETGRVEEASELLADIWKIAASELPEESAEE